MRARVLVLLKPGSDSQDVVSCLTQSGYDTLPVCSFKDAVEFLKDTHVDLIIIDVQVDSDGNVFDFMRWVKKNPVTIETPFVIFSPPIKTMAKYIQDGIRTSARMLGAAMFITMDNEFDGEQFRQQIYSLLPVGKTNDVELGTTDIRHESEQLIEVLNETQKRIHNASTAADVGLWDLNLESGLAWRSEKHDEIFGYSSSLPDWSFEIFLNHVIDEDRAYANAVFESVLETGYPLRMECRITKPVDSLRWISVQGETLRSEKGIPIRIVGTIADITDRKRWEDQHRQMIAINERKDFAATLKHDLRTPLIGSNRAINLLLDHGQLSNEQCDLLRLMLKSNVGTLSLIRNLIEVYRLESAQVHAFSKIHLNDFLISFVKRMDTAANIQGVKIQLEVPPKIVYANADAIGLETVMQNLWENALKFSPLDGTIIVRLIDKLDLAVIEVEDSGPGLNPREQQELFTRDSRLDPDKEYTANIRLGLYLSKTIMEANGGSIEFASEPNICTTFRITLPADSTAPGESDINS